MIAFDPGTDCLNYIKNHYEVPKNKVKFKLIWINFETRIYFKSWTLEASPLITHSFFRKLQLQTHIWQAACSSNIMFGAQLSRPLSKLKQTQSQRAWYALSLWYLLCFASSSSSVRRDSELYFFTLASWHQLSDKYRNIKTIITNLHGVWIITNSDESIRGVYLVFSSGSVAFTLSYIK